MEPDFTTWTVKDIWLSAQLFILLIATEVDWFDAKIEVAGIALVFAIVYRLAGQPN